MLNRRFLRIKVFQALYSYFQEEKPDAAAFRRRMIEGLDRTYDLYLFMLTFPVEFKYFLSLELEAHKAKFRPVEGHEILLKAFFNNKAIAHIESNVPFQDATKKLKYKWTHADDLFKTFFAEFRKLEAVIEYGKSEEHSLAEDKVMLATIFEWFFTESELFESYVEELFPNWEDDQVLVLTTLQKSIQQIKDEASNFLSERHRDEEEDVKFLRDLFSLCLENNEEILGFISAKTQNWDQDRIAMVDMVLMKMTLCEILFFPYIPVKVSINEYLELAKLYSTPQSHGFINGILDKIQIDLRKDNRINKLGRGLVD